MEVNLEFVDSANNLEKNSSKYFVRQILVCSAIVIMFFAFGMCLGAPTVFIPQIRREANITNMNIDDSMASWLSSMHNLASIPWSVIFPISATHYGRKLPYILVCLNFVSANVLFYFSNTVTMIMISEVMMAAAGAALASIGIMVVVEYTSPEYRGVILTFKSASVFWGIWLSNAIGTFFHWKNIALVTSILSFYPLIIVVFVWPESPYYLAAQERFSECIDSHKWLKGKTANSELKRLLEKKTKTKRNLSSVFKIVFSKAFYKPTLLCCCVFFLHIFTGKFVCTMYSLDIIKTITFSMETAYIGMLILDGITVLGMYVGAGLSRFIKRRKLYFSATSTGVFLLFVLSLYTYLISLDIVPNNKYFTIGLLSLYSLAMCIGPMMLSFLLFGELLPIECRSLSVSIVALMEKPVSSFVTKIAPHFIGWFGIYTAFLSFGIITTLFLIILYFYMPETKDKTLYEIADAMIGTDNRKGEEIPLK